MARRVVQIAHAVGRSSNAGLITNTVILTALCDDGTLWQVAGAGPWRLIEGPPDVGRAD